MLESKYFKPLYYLLWQLLHAFVWFARYLYGLLNIFLYHFDHTSNQTELLDKIPRHIAISINEDCVHFDDLVNIILWCEQLDISYLSIFKTDGYLLAHKHVLEERYASNTKFKSDCSLKNEFCDPSINGFAKRFMTTSKLKIRLLISDDSRHSLVNAAKHLCAQQNTIEQNHITEHLKKNYDFPDAEVLMAFGNGASVHGFPPWQIRLTEIYFFHTHRNFKYRQFCQMLRCYSKCQQRFGT